MRGREGEGCWGGGVVVRIGDAGTGGQVLDKEGRGVEDEVFGVLWSWGWGGEMKVVWERLESRKGDDWVGDRAGRFDWGREGGVDEREGGKR